MSDDAFADTDHKNRYYPRMEIEILASYRPASAPPETARVARTRTLGLGGLMFESESPMKEGDRYDLDVVLGEKKLSVSARVVYTLPAAEGGYEVGFAFNDLTDKQRELLTEFFVRQYEQLPPG